MHFMIVEDERHLNNILFDYLVESYPDASIEQVFDGDDALERLRGSCPDMILLDVMLPGADGFMIAREVRATSNVPILMLSAFSDEDNQLRGYDLGIDEFVKKPYSPRLVMKKIDAILQRIRPADETGFETIGNLRFDLARRKLQVAGAEVRLNHNEWKLFELFVRNAGLVMTRETLLDKVWGYDYEGDERTVDTHIRRLRLKLGPASETIETVYKSGYRFQPPK
jgi:two-component system response regulator VanR